MANQYDHALFRQRVSSNLETAQVQLMLTEEKLRREFHDSLHILERDLSTKINKEAKRLAGRTISEVQTLIVYLDHRSIRIEQNDEGTHRKEARLDKLDAKLDRLAKWMIATQLIKLALIVGIAILLFMR